MNDIFALELMCSEVNLMVCSEISFVTLVQVYTEVSFVHSIDV